MKISVFGCASKGTDIEKALRNMPDVEFKAFVENSVAKINTKINGIDVISLYKFARMYKQGLVDKIIIPDYSLGTIRSMKSDLRKNGIRAEDVLIIDSELFISKIKNLELFSDYKPQKLPYIQYLSYEAAEKCNLNCKRCDHFSNIKSNEGSESVDEFLDEIRLLSSKVESIGTFSFLGGEPLLNDDLSILLGIVDEYFPKAQIIILTNGILLKKMSNKLIEAIKRTDTLVRMTLYPPMKDSIDEIVEFTREKGLRFELSKVVNEFWTQINIDGTSNIHRMLNRCVNSDCFVLKRGKIGKCPITINGDVFNEYFGSHLPLETIDLSDPTISVQDIHNYLYNPINTCAYCGYEKFYEWEQTTTNIDIKEMLCSGKV